MSVSYLVVGSFASIAYGESRFAQDAFEIVAAFRSTHINGLPGAHLT